MIDLVMGWTNEIARSEMKDPYAGNGEFDADLRELEADLFEFGSDQEYGMPHRSGFEKPLSEDDEMELAAELLSVSDDAELDQFLGKLIKKAGRGIRRFAKSKIGRTLGRVLKKAAKIGLPLAGRAIGTYFGGPLGGQIGKFAGSAAANIFGLELEGLSPEDQEFEVARRFVRFASETVKNAAMAPAAQGEASAARAAAVKAAKKYAPGLVRKLQTAPSFNGSHGRSGRWIRRGRRIILAGV